MSARRPRPVDGLQDLSQALTYWSSIPGELKLNLWNSIEVLLPQKGYQDEDKTKHDNTQKKHQSSREQSFPTCRYISAQDQTTKEQRLSFGGQRMRRSRNDTASLLLPVRGSPRETLQALYPES